MRDHVNKLYSVLAMLLISVFGYSIESMIDYSFLPSSCDRPEQIESQIIRVAESFDLKSCDTKGSIQRKTITENGNESSYLIFSDLDQDFCNCANQKMQANPSLIDEDKVEKTQDFLRQVTFAKIFQDIEKIAIRSASLPTALLNDKCDATMISREFELLARDVKCVDANKRLSYLTNGKIRTIKNLSGIMFGKMLNKIDENKECAGEDYQENMDKDFIKEFRNHFNWTFSYLIEAINETCGKIETRNQTLIENDKFQFAEPQKNIEACVRLVLNDERYSRMILQNGLHGINEDGYSQIFRPDYSKVFFKSGVVSWLSETIYSNEKKGILEIDRENMSLYMNEIYMDLFYDGMSRFKTNLCERTVSGIRALLCEDKYIPPVVSDTLEKNTLINTVGTKYILEEFIESEDQGLIGQSVSENEYAALACRNKFQRSLSNDKHDREIEHLINHGLTNLNIYCKKPSVKVCKYEADNYKCQSISNENIKNFASKSCDHPLFLFSKMYIDGKEIYNDRFCYKLTESYPSFGYFMVNIDNNLKGNKTDGVFKKFGITNFSKDDHTKDYFVNKFSDSTELYEMHSDSRKEIERGFEQDVVTAGMFNKEPTEHDEKIISSMRNSRNVKTNKANEYSSYKDVVKNNSFSMNRDVMVAANQLDHPPKPSEERDKAVAESDQDQLVKSALKETRDVRDKLAREVGIMRDNDIAADLIRNGKIEEAYSRLGLNPPEPSPQDEFTYIEEDISEQTVSANQMINSELSDAVKQMIATSSSTTEIMQQIRDLQQQSLDNQIAQEKTNNKFMQQLVEDKKQMYADRVAYEDMKRVEAVERQKERQALEELRRQQIAARQESAKPQRVSNQYAKTAPSRSRVSRKATAKRAPASAPTRSSSSGATRVAKERANYELPSDPVTAPSQLAARPVKNKPLKGANDISLDSQNSKNFAENRNENKNESKEAVPESRKIKAYFTMEEYLAMSYDDVTKGLQKILDDKYETSMLSQRFFYVKVEDKAGEKHLIEMEVLYDIKNNIVGYQPVENKKNLAIVQKFYDTDGFMEKIVLALERSENINNKNYEDLNAREIAAEIKIETSPLDENSSSKEQEHI